MVENVEDMSTENMEVMHTEMEDMITDGTRTGIGTDMWG